MMPNGPTMEHVRLYRIYVPRSRRTKSTAIIRNGSRRTVYGCVCGSTHTAATSYRRAKHVLDWEEEHADHLIRAAHVQLAIGRALNPEDWRSGGLMNFKK